MAAVSNTARVLRNLKLTVGTAEFEKHVSNVDFTPSSSTQTWQGGTPDATLSDAGAATWVANVTAVQDWENDDSLFRFLLEHDGEQANLVFQPDAEGDVTFTSLVTIVAPKIGGTVGQYNESSVAMPASRPVVGTAA